MKKWQIISYAPGATALRFCENSVTFSLVTDRKLFLNCCQIEIGDNLFELSGKASRSLAHCEKAKS